MKTSIGAPRAENLLVCGDNLVAMQRLRATHEGRVRCVYMDPPYNSGRTFVQYTDSWSPAAWREMLRERVAAAAALLAIGGTMAVQIDDKEIASGIAVLDEVLGRENRVSIVTVVRSATTGHKAKNRGPVNVSDFLLLYAKDKTRWRCTPQWRTRAAYDGAYSTFVVNRDAPPSQWEFVPLARRAAEELGHKAPREATRALGARAFAAHVERFAIERCESVVRFAQPRYEAVSREAQRHIDRSRSDPLRVLVLDRPGFKPMILKGGNRVLFLADKVREVDGRRVLVEPLTNVWDDVPFQGIAREGGVVFSRNKKPERLLHRIVEMTTDAGDWVLDPFLGSGTTAAVAHKMGRRWIGIEQGAHFDELCVPRLTRVVEGRDPTGITRACGWQGGGGFYVARWTE